MKALEGYEQLSKNCDSIELLKAIREIVKSFESQKYKVLQVYEINVSLANLRQGSYQSASSYLEAFEVRVEIIYGCGGCIGYSQAIIEAM